MPTASDLFIDTSGWAYYLDGTDPLNSVVVGLVKQAVIQRRLLVTTNFIITELVALLGGSLVLWLAGRGDLATWMLLAVVLLGGSRCCEKHFSSSSTRSSAST